MKTFEFSGVKLRTDECEIVIFVDDRPIHTYRFEDETCVKTALNLLEDMLRYAEDDSDIRGCCDFMGFDVVLIEEPNETYDRAYMLERHNGGTAIEFIEEFFRVKNSGGVVETE